MKAKPRVVVLGAGFGGLELCTLLSEALGDEVDATLIDQNDAFVFGYSKLDFMFALTTPEAVRLPYSHYVKPGVTFVQQTVTAIDPQARRVTTDAASSKPTSSSSPSAPTTISPPPRAWPRPTSSTPCRRGAPAPGAAGLHAGRALIAGLRRALQVSAGAQRMRPDAARLSPRGGRPRRLRNRLVTPLSSPVPPSPETSRALMAAFAERGIAFTGNRLVTGLDTRARPRQLR